MSILAQSCRRFRQATSPFARSLFESPEPAGRKITAGFTYIQRISKSGSYDVWFPDALRRSLDARLAEGRSVGAEQFPAQWAAVREFELLQESGNYKIYDLDPQNLRRAMLDLSKSMRAGGYRVTIATLGSYHETAVGDDLEILDRRLQRRISQMIHMLYLEEQSEHENLRTASKLEEGMWNYLDELPHIGMVLGACDLFKPIDAASRKHKRARRFFEILQQLPQQHLLHDTAIGLQLPELNGENEWPYIADPEETLAQFNRVLNDLFDPFNGLSLSHLNGHENAHSEVKSSTYHMRPYGHPLTEREMKFYRAASHALN